MFFFYRDKSTCLWDNSQSGHLSKGQLDNGTSWPSELSCENLILLFTLFATFIAPSSLCAHVGRKWIYYHCCCIDICVCSPRSFLSWNFAQHLLENELYWYFLFRILTHTYIHTQVYRWQYACLLRHLTAAGISVEFLRTHTQTCCHTLCSESSQIISSAGHIMRMKLVLTLTA